jgi:hypothetical protein
MAQQPQPNKQPPVTDTTKPPVPPLTPPETKVVVDETEIEGVEDKTTTVTGEESIKDMTPTKEQSQEEELTLCPDTLINKQLVRGLEGIRELFESGQMSNVGPFHVDTYNALSRALTLLSWEDTKLTLDNIFKYMERYSEGHCHQNIILQNVTFCTLSKSSQLEYTKLMSLFVSLQNPSSRGVTAKQINWSTFPAGFTPAHGEAYTAKFKRYFNIV